MQNKKFIYVWDPDKKSPAYNAAMKAVAAKKLNDKAEVLRTKFIGVTGDSAIIRIMPDNIFYKGFRADHVDAIIESHFVKNTPLKKYIYEYNSKYLNVKEKDNHNKQFRIVLRNSGYIDPEDINDYIERDGYKALEKAVFEYTPDDIIAELKLSGLRGRGGAGFPTGIKWEFTKNSENAVKYVVCNADEGDPGAYMDRSILEGDPHTVLEGMTIAGYTTGASKGFIYIRAEYPLAIKRLEFAIEKAKQMGLLGNNILGSGFSFDIEIRLGAGAFVCGEETALLESIEGKRGMPRPRPPFPAVVGLWGKPTVINNVETWANIPVILNKGGEWFSKIGTEKSKGTKVFALTGKINNPGLVEVPMGTTIKEIVYDIGGGILGGKKLKAVQTGGPSGGVIPEKYLDMPVDYESLQEIGSMMGSGGMIVMDEDDCMIDVVKFYLQFSVDESCGKCSPCRIGGRQMLDVLEKISRGSGEEKDMERLDKIALAMNKASLCGLGQSTPNPVVSTIRYFDDEYKAHIRDKRCKTGKCRDLVTYEIIKENCIGCGACKVRCPVSCISGDKRQPHVIDMDKCIKCGECYNVCKFNAVKRG
ncbi:MAG: NADH-quinone oxidoreductase subunit NuoF [Candidatus Goldiibacteriota bacterium]